MSNLDNLTPKQRRFIEEYLIDLNATQAAIRAGYKKSAARQIGSENLSKLDISEAVAELQAERSKRGQIKADNVVAELAKIAFSSMRHYLRRTHDGTLYVDTTDTTPEQLDALKRFKTRDFKDGRGEDAREMQEIEIELPDKIRTLELLGKHLGLFQDKGTKQETVAELDPNDPAWQAHITDKLEGFEKYRQQKLLASKAKVVSKP
jgi:phage terminase small subunit